MSDKIEEIWLDHIEGKIVYDCKEEAESTPFSYNIVVIKVKDKITIERFDYFVFDNKLCQCVRYDHEEQILTTDYQCNVDENRILNFTDSETGATITINTCV